MVWAGVFMHVYVTKFCTEVFSLCFPLFDELVDDGSVYDRQIYCSYIRIKCLFYYYKIIHNKGPVNLPKS